MATKTLEARFEHLNVNDENEAPHNGSTMLKSKVRALLSLKKVYSDNPTASPSRNRSLDSQLDNDRQPTESGPLRSSSEQRLQTERRANHCTYYNHHNNGAYSSLIACAKAPSPSSGIRGDRSAILRFLLLRSASDTYKFPPWYV